MQRPDYTAVSDGAMRPLRLLLCDSMTLVLAGLRVLLNGEGVEIVGEAVTADEAVRLTQEVRPDAVLLDRDLPGDAVRAIREIKETVAGVQLLVMTESLDERHALRAIEVGAAGYMLKGVPVANLAATMRAVCGRGTVNDAQLARALLWPGHLGGHRRSRKPMNSAGLTPREFEILVELAKGHTDREIAKDFVVSEGTVKTHIRHILNKLGVRNRTGAVAQVLRKRLID